MNDIKIGKYRHYKGKEYEVIGIGRYTETLEELVIYRALYNSDEFGSDALWIRPKAMFSEQIVIDGENYPRFTYIEK